jgi:hypothetical protein
VPHYLETRTHKQRPFFGFIKAREGHEPEKKKKEGRTQEKTRGRAGEAGGRARTETEKKTQGTRRKIQTNREETQKSRAKKKYT